MIHIVKGFGIVNETEIDVFLELSCFFDDPADVVNLISGSSAFSKTSLNICKFTVHVLLKPGLENFEHYFTSVWDECICCNLKVNLLSCSISKLLQWLRIFPVAQMVKNLPAIQETQVWSTGREDPLEKGMAIHSSILSWRIPWTGSLVGHCPWGHKESDTTEGLTLLHYYSVIEGRAWMNKSFQESTGLNSYPRGQRECFLPGVRKGF